MILKSDLEGLSEDAPFQISMHYDEHYMYILIAAQDFGFREPMMATLKPFGGKIATCFLQQTEHPCFGLIFRNPEEEAALSLRLAVEQTLSETYRANFVRDRR